MPFPGPLFPWGSSLVGLGASVVFSGIFRCRVEVLYFVVCVDYERS